MVPTMSLGTDRYDLSDMNKSLRLLSWKVQLLFEENHENDTFSR